MNERQQDIDPSMFKHEDLINSDLLVKILNKQDRSYANCVAKRLTSKQVALELLITYADGKLKTTGNILVKDRAIDGDWIVYDEVPLSFDIDKNIEANMFKTLDKYARDNNLSYTEFNGTQLEEKSLREGIKW